jgi:aryl-alcohol dehydrogenase-like predicted oxidoreductase
MSTRPSQSEPIGRRLALGTAQFGLPYGIANRSGRIGGDDMTAILDRAGRAGITTLDTAVDYGESEQRLGECGIAGWRVVTKLPPVPDDHDDVGDWVRHVLLGSLQRLRIARLYGLLLHEPRQLLGPRGREIHEALAKLKEEGLVEKIGVSVYAPADLDALWPRFHFDLVQAPFNVVDRRLQTSGWLQRLDEAGAEIHARSIFLQGLLLTDAAGLPAAFSAWRPLWESWQRWLDGRATTALRACLGFAFAHPQVDLAVVGVDDPRQMQAILDNADAEAEIPPGDLTSDDIDLIDPSRWSMS